jgi:adenylate cyclase
MPDVQRTGLPCAILFADVNGSTELYEKVGNARAQAAVAHMLTTLSDSIGRHSGRIIKTVGAQIMCVLPNARQAAAAAVDIQQSVRAAIKDSDARVLGVRVGFYYGPVITQDADVFGDAVNMAARVVSLAKPGQILLAKETARQLPKEAEVNIRFVASTQVKGKAEPVDLFELIWERENLTLVGALLEAKREDVRLVATFGDAAIELGSAKPVLQMGRAPENDFVVPNPLASRIHARIEHRRDRFFLVDQSSNGTYLCTQGTAEIVLRRDEIALESSGSISLGAPTADVPHLCLRFTVQKAR